MLSTRFLREGRDAIDETCGEHGGRLSVATDTQVREARLRPAFVTLYPGVDPDVWYIAATLAEHLLSRYLRKNPGGAAAPPRILNPEHFEFRGEGGFVGGRMTMGR
jgi:hypothetical protein